MGRFGLLGERLAHSFSPMIHAELGDYEYRLYEKRPDEVEAFLKSGGFEGLNVTIPYKTAVIPFCDSLSDAARAAGSVNTITRLADGSLHGDTTDCYGFAYLLGKTGFNPAEGKTIILGSGGSSLTVQAVLRDMRAKEIVVISRNGADNYENIANHRDAMAIVNTTPLGMYPNNGVTPISDLGIFQHCETVIDLIYNPARTELLLQAKERGIAGVNGLAMLVAQAKKSAEQFVQASISDNQIEAIIAKIGRMTKNVVLIGMPGCGKSSIGAALAKKMGREFADTDDWVAKAADKPIPQIFTDDGEEVFRSMESEALRTICKRSGLVVATGGGIVKRQKNRNIARQNGIVVFLDRNIDELQISGRPLSEKEGIDALAEARLPLYSKWCDYSVRVSGVEQTAAGIYELFQGGAIS